jgi:hypothetical protein
MFTLYAVCAALGGTIFVCQFIMSLLGLADAGHDVAGGIGTECFDSDAGGMSADHDHPGAGSDSDSDAHSQSHDHHNHVHGSSWFFGVLTFRTLVAAITFFGLAGLACSAGRLPSLNGLAIAAVAGMAAMFAVNALMKSLGKLRSEGTVYTDQTVGKAGEVYLRIPGQRSGIGKVTLTLQHRTMEYQAVTAGDPLPTGTHVIVVSVVDSDTVEVRPQPDQA